MAKGAIAKTNVAKVIEKAFGDNYVGEFDKKYYVWADDGGNKVQIAISLTHPNVYRGVEETSSTEMNFDDDDASAAAGSGGFTPADITPEEQDTLEELMKKLGL